MENFEYEPIDLEDRSFRLVQLSRGRNGPIQCNLFHALFQDTESIIEYEALSYTWGDLKKSHSIEINGRRMMVTVNLFRALWHLRSPNRDRILWIDAICIDQENWKERGHQVQQMASIYKKAEQVVIWFGLGTADTDLVLRSARFLEERMINHACSDWKVSDGRWTEHWNSAQSMLMALYDNLQYRQQEGLKALLRRSWFKRVWIIQEVANARAATVMCGSQSVSARIFSLIPPLIGVIQNPHCQAILDIMPGPGRKHSWWSQNRTLHSLLLKFQASQASDQRDLIYALLGMSSVAYNSNSLVPNYEKSEEEVIQDTLSFLFQFQNWEGLKSSLPHWTVDGFTASLYCLSNAVLTSAVEGSNEALVERLLQRGDVDVNCSVNNGKKLIVRAAATGNTAIVKLLLDQGATIDDRGEVRIDRGEVGFDDLLKAVSNRNDNELIVNLLLSTGISIINVDENRRKRLFAAALNRPYKQVLQLLFNKITGIDASNTNLSTWDFTSDLSRDKQISNPLVGNLESNYTDSEQYLHALFAIALKGKDRKILKMLYENHAIISAHNYYYNEELFAAAQESGNKQICNCMFENAANFCSENKTYRQALFAASKKNDKQRVKQFMKRLSADAKKGPYSYALQEVAYRGDAELVNFLLKKGACVHDMGGHYGTALQAAVVSGQEKIVTLLLDEGASVNAQGGHYGSALQAAVARGHLRIAQQLLDNGADINAQSGFYGSALQAVIALGDESMEAYLRARGATT